ncbi:MAG: hypothetical protein VB959_13155 [Rhodospirillales bacterium]
MSPDPSGTPIVPIAKSLAAGDGRRRYNAVHLVHDHRPVESTYWHLSEVRRAPELEYGRLEYMDLFPVIGFSGRTGTTVPHLHLSIRAIMLHPEMEIDLLKAGIDGGRPVYWDGQTKIISDFGTRILGAKRKLLQDWTLTQVNELLKTPNELDKKTKIELKARSGSIIALREYLAFRVLQKKVSRRGKNYEFMPGSIMYSLMLETHNKTTDQYFTGMLPFIFPSLKHLYQANNPSFIPSNEKFNPMAQLSF